MVRLIKLALISFLFLFGVITVISLLIPSRIRISKAINLPNQKDSVHALVSNQTRWPEWHPAFTTEQGRASTRSLQFRLQKNTDSLVVWQMIQPGKRPVDNGFQVYTYPASDSLTLQWYMDFRLPWYPWQKFGSLFYEGTYGVMMEQGLANIKAGLN
jgi:hypothetical protein